MAPARRTWLFTLCLWLSLATVLGHALAPIGSPLKPRAGSAFSLSTSDVSLGAQRTGLNAKFKRSQAATAEEEGGSPDLSAPPLLAAAPCPRLPRRRPAGPAAASTPARRRAPDRFPTMNRRAPARPVPRRSRARRA